MNPKTFLRAWTRRNHPEQLENLKYWKDLSDNITEAQEIRIELVTPQSIRNRNVRPIPIRCVNDGKEYPSINAAARATGISKTLVQRSVDTGNCTHGKRFVKI